MKEYLLDDVLSFFHGKAIKPSDGIVPIYGSNGIIGKTQKHLYDDAIIIGRVGAYCGSVERCREGFWASDNTIVAKARKGFDNDYCYYLLKTMPLNSFAGGAAQPLITQATLKSLKAKIPDLPIQQRISDALYRYDSLIENNQKQIMLLEEAAQRLYKEWFVDLRFPGHETTPITDGVPGGWRETTVGEYLKVRSGYAFKSSWWQSEGHPVVKIKNIDNNTIDMAEADYVSPDRTKAIPEFKLSKGDVVIAMTGATIGKIGLIPDVDNLYTNQRVGKVFPNECIISPTPFVFCFYTQESVREKIIALSSSSSAQPNISGKQLESLAIVANMNVINLFCEKTIPFFEKINSLRKQITLLTQARDRLLPKLMNGEIEV